MSSLVMAKLAPLISRYCGRVPVAMTKFLAFILWYVPAYSGSCCVATNYLMTAGLFEQISVF